MVHFAVAAVIAGILAASPAAGQGIGAGLLDDRDVVARVVEIEAARLAADLCEERGVRLDIEGLAGREAALGAAVRERGRRLDEAREIFALASVRVQVDERISNWFDALGIGFQEETPFCAALEDHLVSGGALSALLRMR